MDAMQLRTLHDEYRVALEKGRDESLPQDARDLALNDAFELRQKIDAGLIEKEQEREDSERLAEIEKREAAAKAASAPVTTAVVQNRSNLPWDKITEWAERKTDSVSFRIEAPETRTDVLTANAGAQGNYLVPETWYDQVVIFALAQSGVLQASPTIIQTSDDRTLHIPTLATDMAATYNGEGVIADQTNPVFGTVPLGSYRVDGYVNVSDEFLRSNAYDGSALLARLAGRALGAEVAEHLGDLAVGTGSSLPAAVTHGATAGVTCVSATTPTMDELKTLFYSILPVYRAGASWVANPTLTLQVATMKDDDGQYLWQPSNMAAEPNRLFGAPWYQDNFMAASTTGLVPCVFGDLSGYFVRWAGGIEVSFSRDARFLYFEQQMRFARWFDAHIVDASAYKTCVLG